MTTGSELAARVPLTAVEAARVEIPVFAGALRPDHPDVALRVLTDGGLVDVGLAIGDAEGLGPAAGSGVARVNLIAAILIRLPRDPDRAIPRDRHGRSEEHMSELQSRP